MNFFHSSSATPDSVYNNTQQQQQLQQQQSQQTPQTIQDFEASMMAAAANDSSDLGFQDHFVKASFASKNNNTQIPPHVLAHAHARAQVQAQAQAQIHSHMNPNVAAAVVASRALQISPTPSGFGSQQLSNVQTVNINPNVMSVQSSFDLGGINTADLANGISPEFYEYMKSSSPEVLEALIQRDNKRLAEEAAQQQDQQNRSSNSITPLTSPTTSHQMRKQSTPAIASPNQSPSDHNEANNQLTNFFDQISNASTGLSTPEHSLSIPENVHPLFQQSTAPSQPTNRNATVSAPVLPITNAQIAQIQQQQRQGIPARPLTPQQQQIIKNVKSATDKRSRAKRSTVKQEVAVQNSPTMSYKRPHPNSRPLTPQPASLSDPVNAVTVAAMNQANPLNKQPVINSPVVVTNPMVGQHIAPISHQPENPVSAAHLNSHPMHSVSLSMGVKMEDRNSNEMDVTGFEGGEEDVEVKKAMRAERNRQSAAASRERKKHHIKELERRVTTLSQENAQLQVDQLHSIKIKLEKESRLLMENKELKQKVAFKDMEISKLEATLQKQKISNGDDEKSLKRPNTWDATVWAARNNQK